MGLASSQARMLLLTARKSDLEYRAQMISQRKINLAMQTEELANKHTQAISNRKLQFVYYTSQSDNVQLSEDLTYGSLMASNNGTAGNYLIRMANSGKYLVTGYTSDDIAENKYNVAYKLAQQDGYSPDQINSIDKNVLINAYTNKMQIDAGGAFMNTSLFQEAIRNGSVLLYKAEEKAGADTDVAKMVEYKSIVWSGESNIKDVLKTEDDAESNAEWEAKSLVLSNQDKMLDLELNQIQTQHKAIETEYESVKKVIEKNIEVSYKIFA